MEILCNFLLALIILTFLAFGCAPQPGAQPILSTSPSPASASSTSIDTITGNFQNQIRILERDMPQRRSEGYVIPTPQEQADFARIVAMIGTDNLGEATSLASRNHYTLSYYEDQSDSGAMSYLLREQRTPQKGWGLYAFRVGSKSSIIIEAPHPLYDRGTPAIAMDLYQALDVRALLIAGAHRNANRDGTADVAHAAESIFQSVHLALVEQIQAETGNVIILQIHGFQAGNHKGYPQVVLGLGKNAQPKALTLARKFQDALSEQGITTGICPEDPLQDLCAETNVQNSTTQEATFIQVELDEKMRKDAAVIVSAIAQVLGK